MFYDFFQTYSSLSGSYKFQCEISKDVWWCFWFAETDFDFCYMSNTDKQSRTQGTLLGQTLYSFKYV